jgi:hypothetical protein
MVLDTQTGQPKGILTVADIAHRSRTAKTSTRSGSAS